MKKICDVCEGSGKLKAFSRWIKCPNCGGTGEIAMDLHKLVNDLLSGSTQEEKRRAV